ncbi:hypothetical protein DERP_011462 [Dermatophagoides pteronyssinus]|uniref:Uncharacterized protein n=1 Tax=Dermatophagoides pteronyssinus TaxID=6956 RepID=A0ABQ8J5C6_DERPT|nr:hypothetical protein DERP_011462 [Dermatophagoides pteronyssinus]
MAGFQDGCGGGDGGGGHHSFMDDNHQLSLYMEMATNRSIWSGQKYALPNYTQKMMDVHFNLATMEPAYNGGGGGQR